RPRRNLGLDPVVGGWSSRARERGDLQSVVAQQRDAELGHQRLRAEREALALDDPMADLQRQHEAAQHGILDRLERAGGCVQVAADAAGARHPYQIAPVLGLADQLVARRRIQDQIGAAEAVPDARRIRCPQVLAYLDAEADGADLEELLAADPELAELGGLHQLVDA